ncbi:hypothetical protein [Gluconobacter oxydans]|uniref:hypothetical protein n=1 Tax=Gluconobacter oxydans TaxID=442 RepID=UPI0020A1E226|nr:hypothetical protein [Gluconobacter oxydans]MCP1247581.1 hypothetical protein [Gluconobacter oxydans]
MPAALHIDVSSALHSLEAHLLTRAYSRQDGTLSAVRLALEENRKKGLTVEDRLVQGMGLGFHHRLGHPVDATEAARDVLKRARRHEIALTPFKPTSADLIGKSHLKTDISTKNLSELSPSLTLPASEVQKTEFSGAESSVKSVASPASARWGVLPLPHPSNSLSEHRAYSPDWDPRSQTAPLTEQDLALLDEFERPAPAIDVSFERTTSLIPSHKRRETSDLTAHDVAHIQLAMMAAEQNGKPLNAALLVRLDLSTAYREHWNGSAQREPRTKAERAARDRARKAATDKLARTLNNLARPLGSPLSFIQVLECPLAGGAGIHSHILCHLPNQAAAEVVLRAVSRLFDGGKQLFADYRQNPGKLDKAISTHKLPFDLCGEKSFIRHPSSRFMSSDRRWGTAAYFCKSAAQDVRVTIGGQQLTLAQIRPEKDEDGHQRAFQDLRAYQPQVSDMSITRRLRFSQDLGWESLKAQGLSLHDAEDAGWLSKAERGRRKRLIE